MATYGWDASDFDWDRGPMDVAAAVRDGITFFTHKATEGTAVQHVHYGEAMNRARAAGMPFMGAYIVVRTPGNNGHGSIQAQVGYFLAYLDAQTPWWRTNPGFFLQVDLEHWGYDDVAPQYGVEACRLLRAQADKFVIHYAPRWAYGDTIGGPDPLWASSYGTNPAVPYRNAYPGDGSSGWAPYSGRTPTILQYGSTTTIGSQSGCDINAYRGTVDDLRALITGGIDLSAQSDAYIAAITDGMPQTADGHVVSPVVWRLRDEKWQAGVNQKLALLDRIQATGAPTQGQVDAAILKAMQDPTVQKGIGDAIASHLKVS